MLFEIKLQINISLSALPYGRCMTHNISIPPYPLFFFSYPHKIPFLFHPTFLVVDFLWLSFLPFYPQLLPSANHYLLKHNISSSSFYFTIYSSAVFVLQLYSRFLHVILSVQLIFSILLHSHISRASIFLISTFLGEQQLQQNDSSTLIIIWL